MYYSLSTDLEHLVYAWENKQNGLKSEHVNPFARRYSKAELGSGKPKP